MFFINMPKHSTECPTKGIKNDQETFNYIHIPCYHYVKNNRKIHVTRF